MSEKTEPYAMAIVQLDHLRAMDILRSNDKTRYYLNGIFIERVVNPQKDTLADGQEVFLGATLTATDGHLMGTGYHTLSYVSGAPVIWSVTDLIKSAVIVQKQNKYMTTHHIVMIQESSDLKSTKAEYVCGADIAETIAGGGLRFPLPAFDIVVNGSFPDYRRIYQSGLKEAEDAAYAVDGAPINFALLTRIDQASRLFTRSKSLPIALSRGTKNGGPRMWTAMDSDPSAQIMGMVMPMRDFGEEGHYRRQWLYDLVDRPMPEDKPEKAKTKAA